MSDKALQRRAAELADRISALPFPPIAQAMQAQAEQPEEPAMQAIMRAAREVLGSPAAAWEPLELQGMTLASYDEHLREVLEHRLEQRWAALKAVIGQLRESGAVDVSIEDDAAVLHVVAVGLGLALLSPLAPRWSELRAWSALAARLLEALAAIDPLLDDDLESDITWRARVTTSNNPAAVARLLRVLALMRIHVVTMLTAPGQEGRQLIDLVLHAPPEIERSTIVQAIDSVGDQVIVARGMQQDADDIATRVLMRSAELAHRPDAAPQAVADLVLADSYEVVPAAEGPNATAHLLRLQWTVEQHVLLRRETPFTKVEFARASALLALVDALATASGETETFGWSEFLPDGERMWIRLGRPEDAEQVALMHERSSENSTYQRYFTPRNTWRDENLRRLSGGHRGATLVAALGKGKVIALGNIFPVQEEDIRDGEIAVIVDDDWQRRGIGARMMGHLVELAPRLGFDHVVAYVLAQNQPMLDLLRSMDLDWQVTPHDLGGSVTCLRAPVTELVRGR